LYESECLKTIKIKTPSALPNCQRSKFSERFQMNENEWMGFYWAIRYHIY